MKKIRIRKRLLSGVLAVILTFTSLPNTMSVQSSSEGIPQEVVTEEIQSEEPEEVIVQEPEALEEEQDEPEQITEDRTEAAEETEGEVPEEETEGEVPEEGNGGGNEESVNQPDTQKPEAGNPQNTEEETDASYKEVEEDYTGIPTVEELKELDLDVVGAGMEKRMSFFSTPFRMVTRSTSSWTFDAYYVKEDELYYTKKTDDFSLKYQMEFHTSQDLKENKVEIRIPKALLTYRDGTKICPADIAVPKGTVDAPVSSRVTPFNYYEEGEYLVFFNYKKITAGTNAAFQVLYKNLKIMEIVDMTEWSLQPEVTVTINDNPEIKTTEPLTGLVDSQATLSSVTKEPYFVPGGKSYTPGLYTKSQVKSFITGDLPTEYENNFAAYRYVVWEVKVKGSGTQPFNLNMVDSPKIQNGEKGAIVGVRASADSDYQVPVDGSNVLNSSQIVSECKENTWGCRFFVVTAYPQEGTVLENNITIRLTPFDGKDAEQRKTASAQWSYLKFNWDYSGTTIGIRKYDDKIYLSWLDIYRKARERQEDKGDFSFSTMSECNGYGFTHGTKEENMGQYLQGSYYQVSTVDDAVYVYYTSSAEDGLRLTGEDYYFSKVEVMQTDWGYDVWESDLDAPEVYPDVADQKLSIYAMFADTYPKGDDGSKWEHVADVEWNDTGKLTYQFTDAQIARKPWRIKAVHNSVNYRTVCEINVEIKLRHDSPILNQILHDDLNNVRLINISGVMGERFDESGNSKGYFHQQDVGNGTNYKDPGLKEYTEAMYQEAALLMRDSAFAILTNLEKQAASFKTAKTSNDVDNERALVDYCLTAYDGYMVASAADAQYLSYNGIESPGRNAVVFYDLLPYGMRLDPSSPITSGRIVQLDSKGSYQYTPKSWDTSKVGVSVEITENYRGTGRTMLVFHITYAGDDPSVVTYNASGCRWIEGWGLSFRAYIDWKDLQNSKNQANIAAFMPERGDFRPLLGKKTEVACDDGKIVPETIFEKDYKDFGSDINGDGKTEIRNVLYARALVTEDIAEASESGIDKLVRADADIFGIYRKSAQVSPGDGYTYDITVKNKSGQPMQNIVIYDRLEYAAVDRNSEEPDFGFENSWWYGEYQSVVLTSLKAQGIEPVVYYNENRNATITTGTETPAEVLTEYNGWFTAKDWLLKGKSTKDVQAVAVDLSKKTGDELFSLGNGESVTFQIKMTAPENIPEGKKFAYNNPSFYSVTGTGESATAHTVIGNSVKVSLAESSELIVEKTFTGDIPDEVKDRKFEFYLTRESSGEVQKFANQEYELWRKAEGENWIKAEGLYGTDAYGRLTLGAGERAVFKKVVDVAQIQVQEEENPFWDVQYDQTDETLEDGRKVRTVTVKNTYRPVLYVQKKLQGVSEDVNIENEVFTFLIIAGGQPLANSEFWYVDSVRLDGGIPTKVTDSGTYGIGMTDGEGKFQIRAKDIIALFPGAPGIEYKLEEVVNESPDWICKTPTVSGTLPVSGASESITNYYKWKDLYLTKNITHQDPADCTQEFTFKITDENGDPVAGKEWVLMNGDEETTIKGFLSNEGTFTCACGGKTVKIKKLEAEQTYVIEETDSGRLYEKVNGGIAEAAMSLYSSKKEVSITNDYLKRSLSVTKQVLSDPNDLQAASQEFTMTVKVNGAPLSNAEYIITKNGEVTSSTGHTDEDGKLTLKHNETATFKDAGFERDSYEVKETPDPVYTQVYPAEGASHQGVLGNEETKVTFINGEKGALLLEKGYLGKDLSGKYYVDLMKTDSVLRSDHKVTLKLHVTDDSNQTYQWPQSDVSVTVIDQLNAGTSEIKIWKSGTGFSVEPWQTIYINSGDLQGVTSYSLEESVENRHYIKEWTNSRWLVFSQESPENDQPVQGTIAENPIATIVNGVETVIPNGSTIKKRMQVGSDLVPEGAKLVWRVERYDGFGWNPAEDIEYLTFDTAGATCSEVCKTGADGKILLTKTANGYPTVKFVKDKVWLNLYTGANPSDLRIVEVPEESDESWGLLVGYGKEDNDKSYSWDTSSNEAVAFVNANRNTLVEIEKKMETSSDETFTMILRQVLAASAPLITEADQIIKDRAGAGIPYQVYDSENNKLVGSAVTGSDGQIFLKAGQYAQLDLPGDTLWTVSEQRNPAFALKELSGSPNNEMKKLSSNLMLIRQKTPEPEPIGEITITSDMVTRGYVINADTGEKVVLNSGNVVIPENILIDYEIYKVTGIGDSAFSGNTRITGISFPDTITSIGNSAFYNCKYITGDLVIPDSVTSIGNSAFESCIRLDGNLTIGNSVTSIGEKTFSGCSKLTGNLEIPNSVTSIGEKTFSLCSKLTGNLEIPNSVTSIGSYAFYNCSGFDGNLTIGNSVTSIGEKTFYKCSKLTGNLEIPNSVTSIGDQAFYSCSGFNGNLKISGKNATIGSQAFVGCSGFTGDLLILSGVTQIGDMAFQSCSGFKGKLTIGADVTSIGIGAFYNCSGLTGDLVIPDSVTSIGNSAFLGCSGFDGSLTIGNGVTYIDSATFSGCSSFKGNITIPDSVLEISNEAFLNCSGFDGILKLGSQVEDIASDSFDGCTNITSVLINQPEDVYPGGYPWGLDENIPVSWSEPATQ